MTTGWDNINMSDLGKALQNNKDTIAELDKNSPAGTDAYAPGGLFDLQQAGEKKIINDFMMPIRETLATAGMNDAEKQLYAVNKGYHAYIESIQKSELPLEQQTALITEINAARNTEIRLLKKQFLEPFGKLWIKQA
jgi:hypothetical protein